ncbi:ribbon-helix-helix protein, CopG family [Candidatus Woesearchaeota archaeon]|nr:ribbon-helix-helix protein, CopG family [Candidatus Woesearchaeota archaeon]
MRKIPFPISIDEELAEKIKQEVEKGVYRNRSHLVEEAILRFKRKIEEEK